MITLLIVLAALVLGFLFFSKPELKWLPPTADIETPSGRTTLYHYRANAAKGQGTILLVHGFCENQLYFQCVADPLTEAGYDCMAVNLFGYNGSLPNTPGYTVQDYARQLNEALLELKRLRMIADLVVVWGHSMGGATVYLAGADIVTRHPEVRLLVLENPGFGPHLSWLSRLLMPMGYLANFRGPRRLVQAIVNLLFLPPMRDPRARAFIKRMVAHYAPSREVSVANLRSLQDLSFRLEQLSSSARKKLCWVLSEKDKLVSFKKVRRHLIEKVRREAGFNEAHLHILPEVDHFVSLQAPKEIARFVLAQLPGKPVEAGSQVAG